MGNTEKETVNEYFKPRKTIRRKYGQPQTTRQSLKEGAKYMVKDGVLVMVEDAPTLPAPLPIQLIPGETYKSRDGRKVKVFAINKSSVDFPVVGMIEMDKVWKPMVWNEEGITKRPYGAGNDIQSLWSET